MLGYFALPILFKYLFDFLSPIRDAFFLTVSRLLPSFLAIFAVGFSENSLFSVAISAGLHILFLPLLDFFAIFELLP